MDNDRRSPKISWGKKSTQAINKIIPLYLFIIVSASFPSFFLSSLLLLLFNLQLIIKVTIEQQQ